MKLQADTFDLPKESILVASTNTFINQAFIIGKNVIGLQFHLEMNEQVIEQMLIHDGHELEEQGSFIQQAAQIKSSLQYLEQNKIDMFLLLDKFFAG